MQYMFRWHSVIGICLLIHRWLVLWVQFPLEATSFLPDFETSWCQFCKKTKMPGMSNLCYFGKTRPCQWPHVYDALFSTNPRCVIMSFCHLLISIQFDKVQKENNYSVIFTMKYQYWWSAPIEVCEDSDPLQATANFSSPQWYNTTP